MPGSQTGPLDSGPQEEGGLLRMGQEQGPLLPNFDGKRPCAALLPPDGHGDQGLGFLEKGTHHTVIHWA